MAFSQETVIACMGMGVQGTPRLVFTQPVTFTGQIFGNPNTLVGLYSGQSIKHFNDYNDFYNSAIDEVYFVPDTVIDGVVAWKMTKTATSDTIYFRFVDENNQDVKYTSQLTCTPAQMLVGNTHYAYYGCLGFDEGIWDVYTDQPLDLVLTADPQSAHLGVMLVSTHTGASASLGFWGANPMWVDNMSDGALLDAGNAGDYIDALFNGKYDLYSGMIGGFGGAGGGGGGQYRPSYGIAIPNLPTISAVDTGMVSLYALTPSQMQQFAGYMWDNSFWNSIIKNFASPMDNIICLQSLPMSIHALSGSAGNIVIGNLDSGIGASKKLTTTYYTINCGTLKVDEYYRSFADYSPYVQMSISIPFCGIVNIDPDDCMGGYINVVYHVDVFSGSLVAFIRCYTNGVWTVLSQHSGNMQSQFPVTGRDYANVYIGAINSIGALSQGNLIGAMSSASNVKPQYQRSGGVTSVAGLMGVRIPYLIISTPKYIMAENFREVKGYTSNLKVTVKNESGYLQATADNSELSSIPCTDEERDMIRKLLADGIYLS